MKPTGTTVRRVRGALSRALAGLFPESSTTATEVWRASGKLVGSRAVSSMPLLANPEFFKVPAASAAAAKSAGAAVIPYTALSPQDAAIHYNFLHSQREIIADLNDTIKAAGLERSSIAAGHKIIAIRTTLLTRFYMELQMLFNDPVARLRDKIGPEELAKRIAANRAYIRLTMHPTEGQSLEAIINKSLIVKIETCLTIARHLKKVSPKLLVDLSRISKNAGFEEDFLTRFKSEKRLPDLEEFEELAAQVRGHVIKSLVEKPIHHVKKITMQEERDMLLYHADRCKREVAKLSDRYAEIEADDMLLTSWAEDMDGKPHVKPGHGLIFEFQSQRKFFISLLEMLSDKADEMELSGIDVTNFREKILAEVEKIAARAQERIFVGDEAQAIEESIISMLDGFEKESGTSLNEVKNYVQSSGCKTMKNGFSTREEIGKSVAALDQIMEICPSGSVAEIAANFARFSEDTKRQLMIMMESAALHPIHEHVISQFDCEVGSYKKVLQLFEIAKKLPAHHESIPYFREYYAKKNEEAGFDIYHQLFSATAIAKTAESLVQLSPLAEEAATIPKLVPFTTAMLSDAAICDYTRRAGGIVRQTRSNSDGSASLGPHKVIIEYLKADIAIRKMVEEAGFQLEVLQGIGANDIERMAPWNLELLQSQFTAQGGDMQHLTAERMLSMLLKEPDFSEEIFSELREKYSDRIEELEELINFYYYQHIESEEGVEVEIDGKKTMSGFLTHRGPIPGTVIGVLGRLSSRPDSRKGDVAASSFDGNEVNEWHESVYNPAMRRIGAISLQRIAALSTFVLAPFYHTPKDFDPEMVADLHAIPLIQNNIFSAIFALGCGDIKSFMLVNGLDFDIPAKTVIATAKEYEELIRLKKTESKEVADAYAKEKGFDTPEGMRSGHLCYQINGCRFVLRNAITPLLHNASKETKTQLEKIFAAAESGDPTQDYHELTQQACLTLVSDPTLDLKAKMTIACISQQMQNVRRPGNFYDTRRSLIEKAHEALSAKNEAVFKEACEELAIITRSAGNPVSPGRKTHELFDYFRDTTIAKSPAMAVMIALTAEKAAAKSGTFTFAATTRGGEERLA